MVIHNKTGKAYPKLILDISSIYQKLKIRLAPELSDEKFIKLVPEHEGFMKFMSCKIDRSSLGINMDLCNRNLKGFLTYIDDNMETIEKSTLTETRKVIDDLHKRLEAK